MSTRHLVGHGFVVNHPSSDELRIDPAFPFTYCRLCGEAFQDAETKTYPNDPVQSLVGEIKRKRWSNSHASFKHSEAEHKALENSGMYMTAEAQFKLAPLGVISAFDLALSEEHKQAGLEAPRIRSDL